MRSEKRYEEVLKQLELLQITYYLKLHDGFYFTSILKGKHDANADKLCSIEQKKRLSSFLVKVLIKLRCSFSRIFSVILSFAFISSKNSPKLLKCSVFLILMIVSTSDSLSSFAFRLSSGKSGADY